MPKGAFLQLFPVVWIFPRYLVVIGYYKCVSQWVSPNLLRRSVSHGIHSLLIWSLPLFSLNEMAISKVYKTDTFESHNSLKLSFNIFKVYYQILLDKNFSLYQTLLIFLFYMRQTWKTQLILEISAICLALEFICWMNLLLQRTYLNSEDSYLFSAGFTLFGVLSGIVHWRTEKTLL